jgi:uncharacterized BrkB/YihY/UPF0761 family membrane protein
MNTLLIFGNLGTSELIIILLAIPIFMVIPIVICIKRAQVLNQSQLLWGILAYFLSYVAVLIAYLMIPERKKE